MLKSIVRLMALAGVLSLLFMACSKDDDTPPENKMIQGNWQFDFSIDTVFNPQNAIVSVDTTTSDDVSGAYFNLKADGKFEANLGDTAFTGSYRLINGNRLELTNNQGISDDVPVITLTDTKLVFMVEDDNYGNGNYSREYFHLKK